MKKWFSFVDTKTDVAEISIFEEIGWGGVEAKAFIEMLNLVKDKEEIHLYLNSCGGDAFEGMAVYNALAALRDKLTVEVIGVAASISSVIALAGKELIMDEGTYFVIHNPWTIAMGESEDLRKNADSLDKIKGQIAGIYAAHSNLSEDEISKLMDDETWMTAEEALKNGFATSINVHAKAAASLVNPETRGFKKVPRNMIREQIQIKDITVRDYEEILRDAGFSKTEATMLASIGFPKEENVGEPQNSGEKEILEGILKALKEN